ncbi:MAG: SelL-related redox protein [Bryobacteraceae bacterium]
MAAPRVYLDVQSGNSAGAPGVNLRVAESHAAGRLASVLNAKVTQRGANLASLSLLGPVLVVFIRHAGCTFCRQSLADIAESRAAIEANGTRIVIVHMGSPAPILALLSRHGLQDLDRIEDPDRALYRAFGLRRGSLRQLFGMKVWIRGLRAGLLDGHGIGRPDGDVRQLPGVFLLDRCEIVRRFRPASASDRLPVAEVAAAG